MFVCACVHSESRSLCVSAANAGGTLSLLKYIHLVYSIDFPPALYLLWTKTERLRDHVRAVAENTADTLKVPSYLVASYLSSGVCVCVCVCV